MSKVLAKLLEQPQEAVDKIIAQLEAKNGYPSHDIRATTDSAQQIRCKIGELGLDPGDTTAEELQQALLIRFVTDSRRFDEHFGLHGQSYDKKVQKAVDLVSKNINLPDSWALKNTAAKQLLREHQPKKTMKLLHYRSVDSLVKRESPAEIYLAVERVESPAWNKAHFKLASQLDTTAFERRQLKLQALVSRWGVWQSSDPLVASNDYGVLGILPTTTTSKMSLLALTVLLLDGIGAEPSAAARFSPAAAWWSETDGLIAGLDGGLTSLNLKDVSLCQTSEADGAKRHRLNAQGYFWKNLLGRYENQLLAEEDKLPKLEIPALNIGAPLNQPAFEYVEDI